MRRLLVGLFALAVSYSTVPSPAPAMSGNDRVACETYCMALVISCYMSIGWWVGSEKCDLQYEGCMAGCLTAAREGETDKGGKYK